MMNACIAEIEDIRNCCDCYSNLHDSKAVVKACSKPHIVLWVKYGAFPWWPAKLLKIDKGNYPLEGIVLDHCVLLQSCFFCFEPHWTKWKIFWIYFPVRFFGDFSSGCVTFTDCYLYSNEDPNVWCGDTKKADFYEAIKVSHFNFSFAFFILVPLRVLNINYLSVPFNVCEIFWN